MKTYSHLYEFCLSEENRRYSVKKFQTSKRIRKIIKRRNLTNEDLVWMSYKWIQDYPKCDHVPVRIIDGAKHKVRLIYVPTLEELVVQHAAVNALKPVFYQGMYEHSYASTPGRGPHDGKRVIEKWIKNDPKNCKYVLKMDIHHFFDNISIPRLKAKIAKYLRDKEMIRLLYQILDSVDGRLPLGFYTSPWLANWYLKDFDHFVKEQLKATHYVRYMDDMVIFGNNKKILHKIRRAISDYLAVELGLHLKDDWQVFRFSHGDKEDEGRALDFMGFRFYHNRTVLRRSIMYKSARKAKRIYRKEKPTIYDARQMLSYVGWIDCTNTHRMYIKWIQPYVNFGKLIYKVSRHDKYSDINIYHKLVSMYSAGRGA